MFQPKRNTCYFIFVLKASKIKVVCGMQLLQIFYISFYRNYCHFYYGRWEIDHSLDNTKHRFITGDPATKILCYQWEVARLYIISNFLLSMFQVWLCLCITANILTTLHTSQPRTTWHFSNIFVRLKGKNNIYILHADLWQWIFYKTWIISP